MEVAVIDSEDCEAWHRARGIKLTLYKEMVTLLPISWIFWIYVCMKQRFYHDNLWYTERCVRDIKRAAGMLVRFACVLKIHHVLIRVTVVVP